MLRPPVHPLVLVGRISAVIGMSLALALAVLLFMAGAWLAGLLALLAFLPFFGLLHLVERFPQARPRR